MDERGSRVHLIRRGAAVPDRLPGKTGLAHIALRPFLSGRMARIPDGFGNVLRLPGLEEPISVGFFASGVYKPDTLEAILRHLHPTGAFVDVGANVGAIALPVAVRRPDARIVCIEADPQIALLLRRKMTENQRSNIRIIECVAGPIGSSHFSFCRAPRANSVWDPSVLNSALRP